MDTNEPQVLKSLHTKRRLLKAEIKEKEPVYAEAKETYESLHEQYYALTADLRKTENDIKAFKKSVKERGTPVITEHAMLRYVENVYGINLEDIQKNILSDRNIEAYRTLGNGKYPVGDSTSGCKAVIKNGAVVTVIAGK